MSVDILVAHYSSAREEIIERIRQRDQYMTLYGTAIALLLGVVIFDFDDRWLMTALIPFLSAVVSGLYAQTDVSIGALGKWLRHSYAEAIAAHGVPGHSQWDGSPEHAAYVNDPLRFGLRYLFVAALLTVPSVLACIVCAAKAVVYPPIVYYSLMALLVVLTAVAAALPPFARHLRKDQLTKASLEQGGQT